MIGGQELRDKGRSLWVERHCLGDSRVTSDNSNSNHLYNLFTGETVLTHVPALPISVLVVFFVKPKEEF
jgi:hypothetical protein